MVNAHSIHAMWSISIILSIFKIFICSYQCELITAKTEKVGYLKAHVCYNPGSVIGTLCGWFILLNSNNSHVRQMKVHFHKEIYVEKMYKTFLKVIELVQLRL